MASELIVQTIQGPSSGANANKVLIPSGHTLDASEGFVPPAGTVIDVKYVDLSSAQTFTSTSFSDITDATITVTPKSSTSKFYVHCVCQYYFKDVYTGWQALMVRLMQDSTVLIDDKAYGVGMYYNPSPFYLMGKTSQAYLSNPNTTSPITYKAQAAINNTGHSGVSTNQYGRGHFTVMEIAG